MSAADIPTFPRPVLEAAFPGQPRLVASFEAFVDFMRSEVERLTVAKDQAETAAVAAATASAGLNDKQPLNDNLSELADLISTPGVVEQTGAGTFAIRPIDAPDTASLITRAVADTRYASANVLGLADGDKGDVIVSGSGLVWSFDPAVVSAFARTILDDANGAGVRGTIGAEAAIAAGTAAQYWRGDKTWQTLDKSAVGLGSADNTADATKNVLSATKLTTARTIAATGAATGTATSFDGSANISIPITGVDVGHAGVTGQLAVARGGTGATATTGTGSNVLSASPTLTGIVTAATNGTNGYFWVTGNANSGSGTGAFFCDDGVGLRLGSLTWAGVVRRPAGFYGSTFTANIGAGAATSPALSIASTLAVSFPGIATTASAANAFLDSAASNNLLRSTSSKRYKTDIEAVAPQYADAVLGLRPVWYRSKAERDNPEWGWWGLIAEEVAKVDPRLVHWGYRPEDYYPKKKRQWITNEETGERIREETITWHLRKRAKLRPDSVQYDRVAVLLLSIIQRQEKRIAALEAR